MGTKTQKLSNVVDQIVEWQSVFTGDGSTGLTAVAGRGYFIDTTSGTVTVTLPASPKIGDIVQLKDYARTWGTNAVSIASAKFDGTSKTSIFSTEGQTVTLVYMDGTKGWSLVNEDTTTDLSISYIVATGGTVTTSGDYKIHTFTGDGCFVVTTAGIGAAPSVVDYLVVAGGAGGANVGTGSGGGGGGGAGGFRESHSTCNSGCYTASPLATPTGITVTTTTYPITVGGGGAAVGSVSPAVRGNDGSPSIFSTITSAGGGGGGAEFNPIKPGAQGGSGGGAAYCGAGGTGNTPPTSPPQGNPGGSSVPNGAPGYGAAGGGGAGANGGSGTSGCGGDGGAGVTTSISGSSTAYAGGGAGSSWAGSPTTGGTGGGGPAVGGPGPGVTCSVGTAGTANTGGGAGGSHGNHPTGVAGGKGIVILRYKFQN
jgi:hypothetical protein